MADADLAVVFDLDGTLVDSREDIVGAVNFALLRHGFAERSAEDVSGFVGDGARFLVSMSAGLALDDCAVDSLLETYLEYYADHPVDRTRPMPGASRALEELAGVPLTLCTNKPRRVTDRVLAELGLERHFRVVVAGGDLPKSKPHPEPLFYIARRLGIAPVALVMVGDGTQDVQCGRAAGARTIALLGGFAPAAVLARSEPNAVLRCIDEVPALVRAWRAGQATSE